MTAPFFSSDPEAPLDPGARRVLETAFGVDLAGVRIHCGPRTDEFLRRRGVPAAAAGHRVFMPRRQSSQDEHWMHLLAHEVAHTLQQACGIRPDRIWELDAEIAARQVLSGVARPPRGIEPPRARHGIAVLADFDSWEHVLLGDLSPADMLTLATQGRNAAWVAVVTRVARQMYLWRDGRAGVTAGIIQGISPDVRLVTLKGDLLATYGEINALADYIPNVASIVNIPHDTVFGFLQTIRQETYSKLQLYVEVPDYEDFKGALQPFGGNAGLVGLLEKFRDMNWVDSQTLALGENHYIGLLARNACHFAPFAWQRWLQAHVAARDLADQAHLATGDDRARLTNDAWISQCYADHFLQDCFAPGHLTNKTQVMQWFVEWRASPSAYSGKFLIPVPNWESARHMTTANQPGLQGKSLYRHFSYGPSNDPQTSDEHSDMTARINATGVTAYPGVTQQQAYHQYLQFLRSSVVQLSSNLVHDYFNSNGLTVISGASRTPFTIFGDGHLLKDGAGVSIVSGTVHASQGIIKEIIDTGASRVRPWDIIDMLPGSVKTGNDTLSLQAWHIGLQSQAEKIFDTVQGRVKILLSFMQPSMGVVSRDELPASLGVPAPRDAAVKGAAALKTAWTYSFIFRSAVTPFWDGERLYAGVAGSVYEFQPVSGALLKSCALPPLPLVPSDVSLASDDKNLYAGTAGRVTAVSKDDFSAVPWQTEVFDSSPVTVTMTFDQDLYAASADGGMARLSWLNGAPTDHNSMDRWGWNATRLAIAEKIVVVGMTERLVALDRTNLSTSLWEVEPMDNSTHIVDVLAVGGAVMAADGGQYRLLDPAGDGNGSARFIAKGSDRLTGEVRQATDGVNVYRGGAGQLASYSLTGLYKTEGAPPVPALNWIVDLTPNGVSAPKAGLVNILAVEASIFASVNGAVYHVNPADGSFYSVTPLAGAGSSEIRMASDGVSLYCGVSEGIPDGSIPSTFVALTLNTDS